MLFKAYVIILPSPASEIAEIAYSVVGCVLSSPPNPGRECRGPTRRGRNVPQVHRRPGRNPPDGPGAFPPAPGDDQYLPS